MHARVLLFGHNERLLRMRKAMLALDGFFAITASDLSLVDLIALVEPIKVLVLCHTLSAKDQSAAIAKVRRHRPSVLTVNLISVSSPPIRGNPAAIVFAPEAPHSLANAIRDVLETKDGRKGAGYPRRESAQDLGGRLATISEEGMRNSR